MEGILLKLEDKSDNMNDQRLGIAILSALGMLTAFMPWVKLPVLGYVLGTEHSGWITFGILSIPFILAFIGNRSQPLKEGKLYVALGAAIIAAGIGIWEIFGLDSGVFSSVEYGLYLLVLASTVIPVAAFILGNNRPNPFSGNKSEKNEDISIKKAGAPD